VKSGKLIMWLGIVSFFLNGIGLIPLIALVLGIVGFFISENKKRVTIGFVAALLGMILNLFQYGHLG